MALQKSVNFYPAVGVAGQQVHLGQAVYTPLNYLSDGSVKAGSFCFVGSASTNVGGAEMPVATFTDESATAVLGFVERTFTGLLNYAVNASLKYPEGEQITVAIQGDYYHEATGVASVGNKVLVNPATGAVSYGSSASAGLIDTGWVVKTASSAEGDIIVISNHHAD